MKSNATLRLTRRQYRQFAEQIKAAGCCLSLKTFRELGCNFGMFDPCSKSVCIDASQEQWRWDERSSIELSTTVNTELLRSIQRPEMDWSVLEDHEIYPFIVAHELGHWIDNFRIWDMWGIPDSETRQKCEKSTYMINEVLADRFAWAQIRPGQLVPLCEEGKRREEEVATTLAYLSSHVPRVRRAARALPSGQYAYIPQDMLMTDQMTAYVGARVSPSLVERTRERRRVYRRDTRVRG